MMNIQAAGRWLARRLFLRVTGKVTLSPLPAKQAERSRAMGGKRCELLVETHTVDCDGDDDRKGKRTETKIKGRK